MITAVIGAPDVTLFGFDDRVDSVGMARRHRNADASCDAGRQPVSLQPLPMCSAIMRAIQTAARSAARNFPRLAPELPHAGEDDVRMCCIPREVRRTG